MDELIGSRLSHYRIVSRLGAGGMGAVYRAQDERLGRDLALKVLLVESMGDANARARLVREAQMASSLNHPHIAHIYEVGEDSGRLFIAMELVEGRQLKEMIPPRGLPTESLLEYGTQIAGALGYAHHRGVIHRDLKTTNIMITPEGWAMVLDFGLARSLGDNTDEPQAADQNLTASGMLLGTPNYLPPEVLLGSRADARSDVWSLGVVLYEMAAGKLPFEGSTLAGLAGSIVNSAPSPLSAHVPVGIQAIIGQCLAKDPNHRYHNGGEAEAAIETLLRARNLKGARVGSHRVWAGAGVALVAAVVLGFALARPIRERFTGSLDRPHISSLAVLPLVNFSGDPAQEYFADGMTEELITNLAPIPSLKVISRTSVMQFKNSKEPLPRIARALGVDAIVEGSVQREGDHVRITAQLIEASSDHHLWARSYERDFRDVLTLQTELARDIAQQIQIQLSPQMNARLAKMRPVNPQAYELYLHGRHEWSTVTDAGVRRAITYFGQALAIDPADARYSSGLADAYLILVQVTASMPAREGMARVKENARRALAADENSAEAHSSMGAALFFGDWNWKEAEDHFRHAIELNPGYSTAHLVYSALLSASGRFDEATEQDRLAQELDPLSLINKWNAAANLCLARRYAAALAQANRALELEPNSPLAQGALFRIYEDSGDYDAALNMLDKFLPEANGGKALASKLRKAYVAGGAVGYWKAQLETELRRGDDTTATAHVAGLYARIGDHERTFQLLERAYARHSSDLLFMMVEPSYDSLHGDPRFQSLLRRIGLNTTT